MIRVIVDRGRSLRNATGLASGSGGRVACLPSLSAALYGFAAEHRSGRHATRPPGHLRDGRFVSINEYGGLG